MDNILTNSTVFMFFIIFLIFAIYNQQKETKIIETYIKKKSKEVEERFNDLSFQLMTKKKKNNFFAF